VVLCVRPLYDLTTLPLLSMFLFLFDSSIYCIAFRLCIRFLYRRRAPSFPTLSFYFCVDVMLLWAVGSFVMVIDFLDGHRIR
jgi:hypothetical protein